MATTQVIPTNSEAAIFARLWDAKGGLSPQLARHVLKLAFSEADMARMNELAERNQNGKLTSAERTEFDSFVKVGDLLAILQSKARKLLKQPVARNGHG